MHIPTHILSGWCIGNVLPLNGRERLFCMVAASVADFDGLGIIFGEEQSRPSVALLHQGARR